MILWSSYNYYYNLLILLTVVPILVMSPLITFIIPMILEIHSIFLHLLVLLIPLMFF